MKSQIIPVFFATDNNYIPFLAVALKSMQDNANKKYTYNIHILHNGLSAKNVNLINKFNNNNFNIIYNDVAKSLAKFKTTLFTRDYYSQAIYYRLFIPSMFPEYKKAIYLDCDVAVKGDISELFSTELENNLLGAVADEAVGIVPEFQAYTKNFLDVEGSKYFNSGVLVMNLDELRNFNFENKFVDLLNKFQFKVAPDQDCLNVLCKDKITFISKVWNKMPFPDQNLTVEDLKLIHYNLSYKPWHYDDILYEKVFWNYAKQTEYLEDILLHKANYTDEQKQNDQIAGERLIKMALEFSKSECTFKSLLASNVIVLENLGQAENNKSFEKIRKISGLKG